MKISILDAQHTLFEGAVSEAVLPAIDGELSLFDDHETIYVSLAKGFIRLQPITREATRRFGARAWESTDSGKSGPIFINRGLARMKNNELVILVE